MNTTPKGLTKQLDQFTLLDKSLLEKELTCNICSRYLNVLPVGFNESIGNVCGRCHSVSTLNDLGPTQRQQVYENLIKNFTFPCVNQSYGCEAIVKLDDVQSHEKTCRFQCTCCPLFYKTLFPEKFCMWTGNSKLLFDHLKTHQDTFLDPPQFVWPEDGKNMIFFTTVGNQIVTVVIKHEKASKYSCLVMADGTDLETQCFRYQLELADEDKSNALILRRNRLETLGDFMENLNYPEKMLEVDIEKISEMLHNPKKVHAKFGIVKKNKKEIIQITGAKDGDVLLGSTGFLANAGKEKNLPPDEEMLSELECPVCNEFMIPPIFICSTGHSVCNMCISQVQKCPSCRKELEGGRNFTLEKLTQKVKYPCRNREIGCGFTTTSDKIRQHESCCELSEFTCILMCGWKGMTPDFYNHLMNAHDAYILQNNTAVLKDIRQDKVTNHYFLYVMGQLFCLSLKRCSKFTLKFNVRSMGRDVLDVKYKYSIQFSTSTDPIGTYITIGDFCHPWNSSLADSLEVDEITIPVTISLEFINKIKDISLKKVNFESLSKSVHCSPAYQFHKD